MTKTEIIHRMIELKGILPAHQAAILIDAVGLSSGPCIEIGALAGASTCCIGLAMDRLEMLLSIDPFEIQYLSPMAKNVVSEICGPAILTEESFFRAWKQQTDPILVGRDVRPVIGDRLAMLPTVKQHLNGKKAGFMFIDGLHTYEAVRDELIAYLPLMKDEAIVAFHDYSEYWGLFGAVNEAIADGRLEIIVNDYLLVTRVHHG